MAENTKAYRAALALAGAGKAGGASGSNRQEGNAATRKDRAGADQHSRGTAERLVVASSGASGRAGLDGSRSPLVPHQGCPSVPVAGAAQSVARFFRSAKRSQCVEMIVVPTY